MPWWTWPLIAIAALTVLTITVALSIRPSRDALIEVARLVPTCLALLRDLMRDPDVPRRAKIAPALMLVYLALPIDLIPDFIPALGHLDDALIVAWALRHLVATAGRERLAAHWQGHPATLDRILRPLTRPGSTTQGHATQPHPPPTPRVRATRPLSNPELAGYSGRR